MIGMPPHLAQTAPVLGPWARYKRMLADPFAPSFRMVDLASARSPSPELKSLDLIDYGVRKCVNTALTGLCVALSAPIVGAIGLPVQAARKLDGRQRWALVPLALPVGLAVGCLSGVANLTVRGMGACFGAAAAVMGAACFPIDLTGCAIAQFAARLDDDHH